MNDLNRNSYVQLQQDDQELNKNLTVQIMIDPSDRRFPMNQKSATFKLNSASIQVCSIQVEHREVN